jgi:hypothetical protein
MVMPRKVPPPTLVKLRCLETPMPEDDLPPDRDRPQRPTNGHHAPKQISLVYTGTEPIAVYVGPLDKHGLPLVVPRFVPATSDKAEHVFYPQRRVNLAPDSPLLHILRSSKMFRAPTYWEDHED